jgi:hypothetical protein
MKHNRSFDEEKGYQTGWDATSVDLAATCLRKYYYTMVRQIKPKTQSVHLIFGGIYASALESFYKKRALGASYETALREVVHEALIASWDHERDESGERLKGTGKPTPFEDDKKTRSNLIRTIVWYLEEFGNEDPSGLVTYHLRDGVPAVELSFTFELADDILYCGHLDRVSQMGDHLYVVDQKTTGGAIGQYFFDRYSPDNQMSGYAYAGKVVLQAPIAGVIIDAAQVAINFSRFERRPVTRSKAQLSEWRENALHHIRVAQSATMLQKFPMNTTACNNYGGCPFKPLCARDPSVRENYIKSDYVEHVWDPLKAR